jgi:hypothetical protein
MKMRVHPQITRKYEGKKPFFTAFKIMNKIILRYGLIAGAVAALLMLCTGLYLRSNPDFSGMEVWGFGGIILSMLFVFIGVRVYREEECNGQISFWSAFKVGGLIALIACVCYALAWMVVSAWLMPNFMDVYAEKTLEGMRLAQKSEAEIQAATADMEHYKALYANPLYKFLLTLMEPSPVAVLVTLVSAFALKKTATSGLN